AQAAGPRSVAGKPWHPPASGSSTAPAPRRRRTPRPAGPPETSSSLPDHPRPSLYATGRLLTLTSSDVILYRFSTADSEREGAAMRGHVGWAALACGLTAGTPALAQTEPQPPAVDPNLGITVTATRFDEARSSIQPSLGATVYDFSPRVISNVPLGENAPLNQVLLRAPGVVQDSFGQIHVRGDHGNVQYRLDGVQLPEGLSLFNNPDDALRQPDVAAHRRPARPVWAAHRRHRRHDREIGHLRSRRRHLRHRRLAQLCAARLLLWRPHRQDRLLPRRTVPAQRPW